MTTTQTTETRCELTELITSHCAHCKGSTGGDEELLAHRAQLLQRRGWIPARYAGTCSACGDWYSPGVAIHRDGDDWMAECCAEDV